MKDFIADVLALFQALADFIWDFPTNYEWYAALPVLGQLPLVIILLVGSGIFFTVRLGFVQVRFFGYGFRCLLQRQHSSTGLSSLTSFMLSTAMRVGPGNILGVTGAVSTGGPGALFWMWLSAFFGMATAFVESTLSQQYKSRQGHDYVGGLPAYGSRLLGGALGVTAALSGLYIVYAILCIPAQGFNSVSALVSISTNVHGGAPGDAAGAGLAWLFFFLILAVVAFAAFGGIRRVTRFTDVLVPIMAVIYVTVVLTLVAFNLERLPGFFRMVFAEAFAPDPIFGGALGLAISQGIKRGLMSNEAGQGTLTMPAAVADANHPCEQGCIQALGVFLDTIVICTLTGFVLIMGQAWLQPDAAAWFELGRLEKFLASVTLLSGGGISASGDTLITLLISVCFGTFAFTSLLGFMSFSEICVRQITTRRTCIHAVRIINLTVLAFGMATNLAGFDLSALWNLSDFANILMVCCNLPFLYLGFGRVRRALTHFEQHATPFNSQSFGEPVPVWDERAVRPAVVTGARS